MKNKISWIRGYSILFSSFFLVFVAGQLFVSDITLSSISDKYLWRKDLIKKYNNFKYMIGDRVFANAVIGKDGWLYYTGDMSIQDFQKTSPMNVGNINSIMSILGRYKERVDRYGGTFLLVIPPDKSTAYPQYMPDEIPVIGQISSLDRLVERIGKNHNIQVLDLRSVLERASISSQIYYKTDSHWNCQGAYYAYAEIISTLAVSHPQLRVYSLNDFQIIPSQKSLLDIPSLMGLNLKEDAMVAIPKFDVKLSTIPVPDGRYAGTSLKTVVNTEKDLPDLMIFHDSFFKACLDKFIEPTFSRTISLHYGDIKLADDLALIDAEKPNIVIVEFVERQMEYFFRHLSKSN